MFKKSQLDISSGSFVEDKELLHLPIRPIDLCISVGFYDWDKKFHTLTNDKIQNMLSIRP